MVKKSFLLLTVCVLFAHSMSPMFSSSRRGGVAPEGRGVFPPDLYRVETNERRDWEKLDKFILEQGPRLKKAYNLRDTYIRLHDFLQSFATRAECYLRERAAVTKETKGDWLEGFKKILAEVGGGITLETNDTLELSFAGFVGFRVLLRFKPIPMGFYDGETGGRPHYNCNPIGDKFSVSEHPFPLQLVSRILYAEEINNYARLNDITNVCAPDHWICEFPWADEELDDENLFVVVEAVPKVDDFVHRIIALFNASYPGITKEGLVALAEDASDRSLLANIVRVIRNSGIWCVDFALSNPSFVMGEDRAVKAVFCNVQRPAFGGGKAGLFFHECDGTRTSGPGEEIESNAGVGLNCLVKLLAPVVEA